MTEDPITNDLLALARRHAEDNGASTSDLDTAVALDDLASLAKALSVTLVRQAVDSGRANWPAVGRVFRISRRAATRRFRQAATDRFA